jgi:hypothetical protein
VLAVCEVLLELLLVLLVLLLVPCDALLLDGFVAYEPDCELCVDWEVWVDCELAALAAA